MTASYFPASAFFIPLSSRLSLLLPPTSTYPPPSTYSSSLLSTPINLHANLNPPTEKMLSAPVKSAKRISSLFSLSSNRDTSSPSSPGSPGFPRTSPEQNPADRRRRSSSRPARLVSNPVDYGDARSLRSPGPNDAFSLNDPLPPPPSLLAVNQDLAGSVPSSPTDGRPQSRGRRLSASRPASSAGLFVPGSGPDSRPGTPSKRRSWMPGRMRASSVDTRPTNPQLPSAWIAGLEQKILYDLDPLARGDQVCSSPPGKFLASRVSFPLTNPSSS